MSGDPSDDDWDDHAAWWQREFTDGVDPEYTEQILPLIRDHLPAAGRLLDIGAGEGQVARQAAGDGFEVVALDPATAQVAEGVRRGGGVRWLQGSATHLPVPDGVFDAAVACLVFEHIDELEVALGEVARALRPGGVFLLLLNHPLLQTPGSGWIDDQVLDPPEQYWRVGPYLLDAVTMEEVERGVFVRFYHRPLHRYVNTAADHGLVLRRLEEPPPPPGFIDRASEYRDAETIPRLMMLRFERETTPGPETGGR